MPIKPVKFTVEQLLVLSGRIKLQQEVINDLAMVCGRFKALLVSGRKPSRAQMRKQANDVRTAADLLKTAIERCSPSVHINISSRVANWRALEEFHEVLGRLPQASADLMACYEEQKKVGRRRVQDGPERKSLVLIIEQALSTDGTKLSAGKKAPFRLVCETCFGAVGFGVGPETTIKALMKSRKSRPESEQRPVDGGNIIASMQALIPRQ